MDTAQNHSQNFNTFYDQAIPVAEGIFWVGYNYDTIFRTNPYLIVDGDEAVLIDPGSSIDFFAVRAKIAQVLPPKRINHIILHHQDPDLCGSTKQFEVIIDHPISIYNPVRSSYFMGMYGIKTPITKIEKDHQELKLKSGRILKFFMTPYCHAPGAMVTYDTKTKTLFTSDIFGALSHKWELYADQIGEHANFAQVKDFMEPYMGSKEAMWSVLDKFSKLDIQLICPQHGSVIRRQIPEWINSLRNISYGKALKEEVRWW